MSRTAECSLRWLNQSTHSSPTIATWSRPRAQANPGTTRRTTAHGCHSRPPPVRLPRASTKYGHVSDSAAEGVPGSLHDRVAGERLHSWMCISNEYWLGPCGRHTLFGERHVDDLMHRAPGPGEPVPQVTACSRAAFEDGWRQRPASSCHAMLGPEHQSAVYVRSCLRTARCRAEISAPDLLCGRYGEAIGASTMRENQAGSRRVCH
jgi:hypothetical protein